MPSMQDTQVQSLGWEDPLEKLLSHFSRIPYDSHSVRPQRRQLTRLPRPWDSPGKNTGVGCHFLLQCRKVKSESEVTQSCLTLVTPWNGYQLQYSCLENSMD